MVVTGGSGGIGRAVAAEARRRGARVGLVARDPNTLADALAELDAVEPVGLDTAVTGDAAVTGAGAGDVPGAGTAGATAAVAADATGGAATAAVAADVSDGAAVHAAVDELGRRLGPVDVLVHCAGVGDHRSVLDTPAADVERLLAVDYLGAVHACRAVLPAMVDRRRGHVVLVASVAGRVATPGEAAYAAAKFAVVGWAHALALEMRRLGVGVSIVDPGPVDTAFFSRRGVDYGLRWPGKVSADAVARSVVRAVERNRLESYVPRWYRLVAVLQVAAPRALHLAPRRLLDAGGPQVSRRERRWPPRPPSPHRPRSPG